MKKFITEIKERKIRKWLAIYVSSGITIIGISNIISSRYGLPDFIFDIIFFSILFGLLSVIIIAWFHGKEGAQKFKKSEIFSHSLILLGLLTFLYFRVSGVIESKDISNKNIIAVLPFVDFNRTRENDFFADGITEDILTNLSKISDLKVISRTSVMKYKNSTMNILEIAKELGAGSILEGSVRTYGNNIRITGQLIDAENDIHLWAETYDRELKDIFSIQSDISERIAAALHASLSPLEKKLIKENTTYSLDAYTFYSKGRYFYYNYNQEDNEKAIEFFKKALDVDSNYSLALSGLADSYCQRIVKYWYDNSWYDSALVLAKKAILINPNLAESYKSLALAYDGLGEKKLAAINYEKAIKLNPNMWTAIMNYGQIKMHSGYFDDALDLLQKANILAPHQMGNIISLSLLYKYLQCDSLAIDWGLRALSLEPKNTYSLTHLGSVYLSFNNFTKALEYFNKAIEIDDNWIYGWFLGASIQTVLGNHHEAKKYYEKYLSIANSNPEYFYAFSLLKTETNLDSAKQILEKEEKSYVEFMNEFSDIPNYNYMALAEIYSIKKQNDQAFYWWNKAIENGYTQIDRNTNFPYLENIKKDKRFKFYLQRTEKKIDSIKTLIRNKFPEYQICD